MRTPLEIMTALVKKLRRKRKLSSELHSRWGDVSITYPNEGSWSQWEQQQAIDIQPASEKSSEQPRRHSSSENNFRQTSTSQSNSSLHLGDINERKYSVDSAITMPTGYYDAKVRNRSKKSPGQIVTERCGPCEQQKFTHPWDDLDCSDEATEEVMVASKGSEESRKPGLLGSTSDTQIDPYSRIPKSPPLSVTSRMRRRSQRSNNTELTTSVSGTASSKHTSFTSSIPSVPPEDPRNLPSPPFHEKKLARRSKPREPEPSLGQELVPSYDELYG